ncbi:MAG: hypothetical protein JWM89_2428 [Acidimicrobiales bacterium]|nr:hypothetical protein [Acidimicrobiales bacterium]
MDATVHSDSGQGPVVVLLHGVGVGPASFDELAGLLQRDHRVVVVGRPGGPSTAVSLADQADGVADLLGSVGAAGACIAGVSGGATLALLIGMLRPEVVGGLVVHEPLVGSLAPTLHTRFAAAARLAAEGEAGAVSVVRTVMGEATWERLTEPERAQVLAEAGRSRAEVAVFAAFDPSSEELDRLRSFPVITTVGGRSGPERWEAAEILQLHARAELRVVAGSGNAAQLDAPSLLADVIRSCRPTTLTRSR